MSVRSSASGARSLTENVDELTLSSVRLVSIVSFRQSLVLGATAPRRSELRGEETTRVGERRLVPLERLSAVSRCRRLLRVTLRIGIELPFALFRAEVEGPTVVLRHARGG